MKTNDPENKLGIPMGKVTPKNKTSARRLRNKTMIPTNTSLPVLGMGLLSRNKKISKKSGTKNDPPGPVSIDDIKSIEDYRNIE